MTRSLLRTAEYVVQEGSAKFVARDIRFMPHAQFLVILRCTLFISEQNDLHIGMEECPAANGITLNHANVPGKGLRSGKKCDHGWSIAIFIFPQ